jgi:excisionase family DNA binding protein
MEPLVGFEKARAFLNVSGRTLERWLARKKIPARKYGGVWRFNLQELEEFGKKNGSSGQGRSGRANQYG